MSSYIHPVDLLYPPVKFNIALTLIIVPIVLLQFSLGMFYHSSIITFNFANQWYLNILSLMTHLAYCGTVLQVYRYTRTHSFNDAIWALGLSILPVILYLPSGSRGRAFGFLPFILILFLTWESDRRKKVMVALGIFLFVLVYSAGISQFRGDTNTANLSLEKQYVKAAKSPFETPEKRARESAVETVISRFSDFVATGRIITDTPKVIPYRGTEGITNWWQIYVPGFLKLLPKRIDFNDGAMLCNRYGVTSGKGGSSPAMIVGDFFSRWGWLGVIVGMTVLGFILRQIDLHFFTCWDTFTIIFFVLFGRYVFIMVGNSLLDLFIDFARELPAMALISYGLARLAQAQSQNLISRNRSSFNRLSYQKTIRRVKS